MSVNVFGIRHHGPGSSRSMLQALDELKPDVVLIEGPPEAEPLFPLLASAHMEPPIALLIYSAEDPRRASFFPMAVFSPEWQALRYALERSLPVRFIDLPQSIEFGLAAPLHKDTASQAGVVSPGNNGESGDGEVSTVSQEQSQTDVRDDPLNWLARAAGFGDGESWWEHMVEGRRHAGDIFAAITEAMTQLRRDLPEVGTKEYLLREQRREAYMRQCLRSAEKEYEKIAIVCGAWHVPALADFSSQKKEDAALLKVLPKAKVNATCIPWTHSRLRLQSGYKAGIDSPGWYHQLWTTKDRPSVRWLTKVAHLLRTEDMDASAAHVIEAVRLAEALAAVRDRPHPALAELNEACVSVFCQGSDLPMQLIYEKLIVGDQLGAVPKETPSVPLQQDVANEQRRLRLKPETGLRNLDLDLRNPNDLGRSHLLHRLRLLGVGWGEPSQVQRAKGTFHELWSLSWNPEFEIVFIERGAWGNTVALAATAYARHLADEAKDLQSLTRLTETTSVAELPEAAAYVITRLQTEAALANDVVQLMAAVPALVDAMGYGNVRNTDIGMLGTILQGLVTRICVGLPVACLSLDDEAADKMFGHLVRVNAALANLQDSNIKTEWQQTIRKLATQQNLHGLVAGRCTYLLFAAGTMSSEDAARQFSLALSAASTPPYSAAWCDGFLRDVGTILVHDDRMLQLIDDWVRGLCEEHFMQQLATMRRTFSTFHAPERRQIGERIQRGDSSNTSPIHSESFDEVAADRVLSLMAQLLGLRFDPGREGGSA